MDSSANRILVIDDDTELCELLKDYLKLEGFEVEAVYNAGIGVQRALSGEHVLVVLDVMLPDVDGWELLGRLQEHPHTRTVPVIVCSILPEEQLAASLGAASFLRKPISRQDFLAALDRQVGPLSPE